MAVDVEKVMKNMVSEIAENNEKLLSKQCDLDSMENFRRIVPILMERGIENVNLSMFNDSTKSKLFNALGEEHLRKGNMEEAAKSFIMANNKDRLIEVGEYYEQVGLHSDAIDTYKIAESKAHIVRIGNKCLEDNHFSDAIKAFETLGDDSGLEKVGNLCMERGKWDYALKIFGSMNNQLKLIEVGDKCAEENEFNHALKAYKLGNNKEKLNELGNIALKGGQVSTALNAYSLSENNMMVEFIKQNLLSKKQDSKNKLDNATIKKSENTSSENASITRTSEPLKPRTGDYGSEDVSIEKFFYFGKKM